MPLNSALGTTPSIGPLFGASNVIQVLLRFFLQLRSVGNLAISTNDEKNAHFFKFKTLFYLVVSQLVSQVMTL